MSLQGTPVGNTEGLVLNPAFTGLISAIQPSDLGLSANILFPRLPFSSNGAGFGYFIRYNLGENFRAPSEANLARRPGSSAQKVNRNRRLETFNVSQRHLDATVPDQIAQLVRNQTGGADDPNVTEVQFVRNQMLLAKENRAAAKAGQVNAVGRELTPAGAWNNYTAGASNPIADLQQGMLEVRKNSGLIPNNLAIPYEVAVPLSYHPVLRSNGGLRALSERAPLTMDSLADILKALLAIDNVHIFKSIQNVGAVTRAGGTLNLSAVWGTSVYMWYQPQQIAWNSLLWGAEALDTFYYGGLDTAGAFSFYLNDTETTVHRLREDSDFVVFNPELAVAWRNTIA